MGGDGLLGGSLRAGQRRVDGAGGQHAQQFALDRRLQPRAAKRQAAARLMIATAAIAARPARVADLQATPTRRTAQESGQSAPAPAHRARSHLSLHLRVVGE